MQNEQIVFHNPNRPIRASIGHVPTPHCLCDMHFHSEFEFLYLIHGGLCCVTNDGRIELNTGDVVFLNSRVPHFTESTKPETEYAFIQFRNPASLKGTISYLSRYISQQDKSYCVFEAETEANLEIISYITDLFEEKKKRGIASDYRSVASTYLITAFLHEKNLLPLPDTFNEEKSVKKLMPVLDYISENFALNITLEDLSRIAGLNESYLCRVFKKTTGGTPMDYLNFVRVCKSEKMLRNNMSVSEVSFAAGFSSLPYFTRTFKRYNRCSPSEYRKMSRQDDRMMQGDAE